MTENAMNELTSLTEREELERHIDELEEILGETEAQHQSETGMYGDSWPGAQLQIAAMRGKLGQLRAEYRAKYPQKQPAPEFDSDIPF